MKKIIIIVLALLVLAFIIFAPIYKGRLVCGITLEGGCWRDKVNLIRYIQDYDRIQRDNR